jgi:hypothetical protein
VRDLLHATRAIVVRAGHAPAQLLLLRKFVALHPHLVRCLGCPLHQFPVCAVVRIVFVKHGPARHPRLACQLFKRRANHGQRVDHVLAHPAQNNAVALVCALHAVFGIPVFIQFKRMSLIEFNCKNAYKNMQQFSLIE